MTDQKIRVGIIGVQPDRSWAAVAHIPALQALAEFYDITAVATTKRNSADAAAARFGIPLAYDNVEALVNSPYVDLVVVTVKVPDHFRLVAAAIAAGKHVYCEWPLGNGLAEAEAMAKLARAKGVHAVIGLQARFAPAVAYMRDLVAGGFVGEVLSTSVIGTGVNWGAYVDAPNAYTADRANGATLLTIPVGHVLDAVCSVLGEMTEVSAQLANRRATTMQVDTGLALKLTAEDQVAFSGTLESGAVVAAHYRGGMSKGTGLLWEINGTQGDLRITSTGGHVQIFPLSLSGATGEDEAMRPLAVPAGYFHAGLSEGPALNVAEVYRALAQDLLAGTFTCPDFDHAARRHRMLAAIEQAAETGMRQRV